MGLPGSICELWPRLGITEKLRYSYFSRAPLAQLAEQLTLNQRVQGSSPWRCTNQSPVRIPRTGLCCIPHKVGGSGLQPVADEFEVVYREGVDAVQLPLLELTVNCW